MSTIFYNIDDSNYCMEYDHLKFYFSSEFNLTRFKDRYIDYIKTETLKFCSRFRMTIYADEMFLLELYRKIEKRGFKVLYDDTPIIEICSISCIVDFDNSVRR